MASGVANSDTFTVTTPSDTEITLTSLFSAPRHLVFEAMSKPEHIKQWWGNLGDGYSVAVCEVDLRVGGKWRFINKHPQGQAEFYGEYREINAPSRMIAIRSPTFAASCKSWVMKTMVLPNSW